MQERAVAAAAEGGSIRRATRLGTAGHLTLTLPSAVTEALLTRVPAAFHGGIDDVLLTGLVAGGGGLVPAACGKVRHATSGSHAVLLDLEGHGREEGWLFERMST